tara:strand:- start:5657 stop:6802 length:1146 start_codon:yes stop_codon:yes gene_type:complete
MKITIKRTEDQLALVRAMGSNNREEAYEAQAAVAELLGPVVSEVINNAPTIGNLYSTLAYGEDDNPSLPLDLFHDITDENYIQVYSQQVAGGLPYSQVFPAHNELKFSTYTLDSALAFDRKYVKQARLDVVSKTFTRMAQEVLIKQTKTAFNVLATALVKGQGNTATAGSQIIGSTTENRFVLDDFNRLITKSKRINSSWNGGTPIGGPKSGITDLLVSPEMVEQLRSMAYNPINTIDADGTAPPAGADGQVAPDQLRMELYGAAGLPSFYGINIMEINQLGINQSFNKLFAAVVTAEGTTVVGGGNTGTFSQTVDEILIGVDRSKDALIRPVVIGEGTSSEMQILVDDQFSVRQNKIGYYGKLEEGRICIDDRALIGLAV